LESSVIEEIAAQLDSPDSGFRLQAAWILATIGNEAQAAIPGLVRVVERQGEARLVQLAAAQAIAMVGTEQALGALLGFTQSNDPEVRGCGVSALRLIRPVCGTPIQTLISMGEDPDRDVRSSARSALAELSSEESASDTLPALREALRHLSDPIRVHAAAVLADVRKADTEVIDVLVRSLDYPDAPIRETALRALRAAGKRAGRASETIALLLSDDSPAVRDAAAWALSNLGKAARCAMPQLTQALRDEDWEVRQNVAMAISKLGGFADAVPALVATLQDEQPTVRFWVLSALAATGPPAHAALDAIRRARKDPERDNRRMARWAETAIRGIAT
jgi:HEAT repeat protein